MAPISPSPDSPERPSEGQSADSSEKNELEQIAGTETEPATLSPVAPIASHNIVTSQDSSNGSTVTPAAVTPQPITSPLAAADSDMIEKEWVDAVDKIETEDANDPNKEEEDADELSRRYLKQRFGIDIDKAA